MLKTTGALHLQEGEGLGCFARILPFELVRFHTFWFAYASTHVTSCHVMSCHGTPLHVLPITQAQIGAVQGAL